MLRLLSFNGLLIVGGESRKEARGKDASRNLRGIGKMLGAEHEVCEHALPPPSLVPSFIVRLSPTSPCPFAFTKIFRVCHSLAARCGTRRMLSISIAKGALSLSLSRVDETGFPVGERTRKRRRGAIGAGGKVVGRLFAARWSCDQD